MYKYYIESGPSSLILWRLAEDGKVEASLLNEGNWRPSIFDNFDELNLFLTSGFDLIETNEYGEPLED